MEQTSGSYPPAQSRTGRGLAHDNDRLKWVSGWTQSPLPSPSLIGCVVRSEEADV